MSSFSIDVPAGGLSLLLLGERRNQLAAEGRDIWDHATPDRVKVAYG